MNTKGWVHEKIGHDGNNNISDFQFADTYVEYLCEHFNILLTATGVKILFVDLLNKWHELQYSKECLSTGVTDYMKNF